MAKVDDTGAEICLNLWFYGDDTGIVQRIAGKAYALKGSDDEKLTALRTLSATDHLTAVMDRVPARIVFKMDGRSLEGACDSRSIHLMVDQVFGPLMDKLEKSLPVVLRDINGTYTKHTQKLPVEPLIVLTAVHELPDGRLVANVK